ncbi:MAG: DUF427 domain-containing protein [Actinobacteria bacterium]|nr:DUF427 domain-containing protein [Actinomycetota bacterium]MBI3686467.1 DUF427 domain-containing protein [Actinomycetota bacterium]
MTSSQVDRRGRVRVEAGRKRVRALLGGHVVADTTRPVLVWEAPYYPTYYIPAEDVRAELVDTGSARHSPSRGDGQLHDVQVGGQTAAGAALVYADSPLPELTGLVRLEWSAMSEWLEEDEPVYGHPRDPYTRLDILPSSRHVEVRVDGVLVADSHRPTILFETGLPPRYYLPMTDVRLDLLRPSAASTHCPYKGTAEYWDIVLGDRVHEGLVWGYRTPLPESQRIAGMIAFYDEKMDVTIDGTPLRPTG